MPAVGRQGAQRPDSAGRQRAWRARCPARIRRRPDTRGVADRRDRDRAFGQLFEPLVAGSSSRGTRCAEPTLGVAEAGYALGADARSGEVYREPGAERAARRQPRSAVPHGPGTGRTGGSDEVPGAGRGRGGLVGSAPDGGWRLRMEEGDRTVAGAQPLTTSATCNRVHGPSRGHECAGSPGPYSPSPSRPSPGRLVTRSFSWEPSQRTVFGRLSTPARCAPPPADRSA